MSSTNKTSLGLNMWEASDKPVRQDFVNDNTIIDEKITQLNSNFINKPTLDISFLSTSHLYVTKNFGIVTLRITLTAVDTPVIATYNNADLPITIPIDYRPLVEQTFVRMVVDNTQLEGTYLYVRVDGSLGLGTRYNSTTQGVGHMYVSLNYKSQ